MGPYSAGPLAADALDGDGPTGLDGRDAPGDTAEVFGAAGATGRAEGTGATGSAPGTGLGVAAGASGDTGLPAGGQPTPAPTGAEGPHGPRTAPGGPQFGTSR